LAEIQNTFGSGVITTDGQLRREELARIVFANDDARRKLEAILHPRIRNAWLAQVEAWRGEGRPLAVVVIPLLYETKAEGHFDKIICAACLPPTQEERLSARGWTLAEIARRQAAQWPVEQKMARADHVLWTEGGLASLAGQVERLLAGLDLVFCKKSSL
jgi:dephospho-CoA kinase